jgi:hypothetical protein
MAVIGALLSSLAAMAAFAIARKSGLLDIEAFVRDVPKYLAQHPFRGFGTVLIGLVLSYGTAIGAAYLRHRSQEPVIHPGGTMWHKAFWLDRPSAGHDTVVTIELNDGPKVTGMLLGFTAEFEDNREIALAAPLAFQRSRNDPPQPLSDAFMVFRENDVAYVAGRYYKGEAEDSVSQTMSPTRQI